MHSPPPGGSVGGVCGAGLGWGEDTRDHEVAGLPPAAASRMTKSESA